VPTAPVNIPSKLVVSFNQLSLLICSLDSRFKAEEALELAMTIAIKVNSKNGTSEHTVALSKGVLIYKNQVATSPDASITLDRKLLVTLSVGAISWLDALSQNKINVDNGQSSVERFVKLIDTIN
jgi:alkyl sulfatase BDS1-like metallo-beta-lactamase superfamily hydrolase